MPYPWGTHLKRLLGEDVAQDVDADAVEHVLDHALHRNGQVMHADASLAARGGVQQRGLQHTHAHTCTGHNRVKATVDTNISYKKKK